MKPVMTRAFWIDQWRQIKAMEKSDLELAGAGNWPSSIKGVVCVLVVGVVWFAMNALLVAGTEQELEALNAEEAQKLSSFELRAFQAANLPLLKLQMDELNDKMSRLIGMLPTDAEMPALLDDISEVARAHQLSMDFIRLEAPTRHPFYIEQPLSIRVEGQYHHLAAFITDISRLPRIVTLHDFTLEKKTADGGELAPGAPLVLNVLAKTYRYQASGETEGGSP
ncbi:type 4a pilus biogenesis protein PilO [Larsenimonas salina]|uniref:type 4a pilus biogenesis protein PilO n=1 Tax=Larsenimonas salina TaxID=1295565 RepID=UPI002073EB4F|nr:type 4a pilus biogenesis protein PilO [Larsenimonas salina]MCM5704160.1 type 4a pilus biogenesis protein PilO [Larsenimonas salina]